MISDNVLYGLADTLGMEIFVLPDDKLMVQGSAHVELFVDEQLRLTIKPKALDYRLNKKSREFVSVFHLRGGLSFPDRGLKVSAAVENLTDRDYRHHASGLNEPGRGIVATVDWRF